jgi:hypothetical protein
MIHHYEAEGKKASVPKEFGSFPRGGRGEARRKAEKSARVSGDYSTLLRSNVAWRPK